MSFGAQVLKWIIWMGGRNERFNTWMKAITNFEFPEVFICYLNETVLLERIQKLDRSKCQFGNRKMSLWRAFQWVNFFFSLSMHFFLFPFVIPLIIRLKAKIGPLMICSAYRPLWGGLLSKSVIYREQVGDYYALYSCDWVGFSEKTN